MGTATEEVILKAKINQLIDRVQELNEQLSEKNVYIENLQNDIKMLQMRENASGAQEVVFDSENESEIVSFLKDFCLISREIIQNGDFIKYNYSTKNSELFYKIEQTVFDDYICRLANVDLKNFIKSCIDLALVKSEKNRKCVYTSGDMRVYYVSRPFMDAAVQENQED